MATKSQIQTQINTIDDGGNNTAQEVRDVLGTHSSSLLENSYGEEIQENNDTIGGITIPNSSFSYGANILKQGRLVVIRGGFEYLSSPSNTIFSINNNEFNPSLGAEGYCISANNDFVKMTISLNPFSNNYDFKINQNLIVGERFSYTIIYNTQN